MAKVTTLDQSIFTDEPIMMYEGRLVVMELFKKDSRFVALYELTGKKAQRMDDVVAMLYFVFSPRSMYKKMESSDRYATTIKEQVQDKDWIRQNAEAMKDLVEFYRYIVLSPADRMMEHLLTNIKRYLDELSKVTPDSDKQMVEMVKRADQLYESYTRIEKQLRGEQERMRRGGYNPRLFEYPDSLPKQ